MLGQNRGDIKIGSRYPEVKDSTIPLLVDSTGVDVYTPQPVSSNHGSGGDAQYCRIGSSYRDRSWRLCRPDMLSDIPPRTLLSAAHTWFGRVIFIPPSR